jgi:hypothetical protein
MWHQISKKAPIQAGERAEKARDIGEWGRQKEGVNSA